jgi:hypothetical protein
VKESKNIQKKKKKKKQKQIAKSASGEQPQHRRVFYTRRTQATLVVASQPEKWFVALTHKPYPRRVQTTLRAWKFNVAGG